MLGTQNRGISQAAADTSELETPFAGMGNTEPLQPGGRFCLSFGKAQRPKTPRSPSVLKRKIQPAFNSIGILGVGWHTFRHTVGAMLAEMGEHQLTIRDYLEAQQPSCHQQILTSDVKEKAFGTRKTGRGYYASRVLAESHGGPMKRKWRETGRLNFAYVP